MISGLRLLRAEWALCCRTKQLLCSLITASDRTCTSSPSQNIVRLPISCLECHAADPGEGRVCLTPPAVLRNLNLKLLESSLWFLVQRHDCLVHFARKELKHCSATALFSVQVYSSFLGCIGLMLYFKSRTEIDWLFIPHGFLLIFSAKMKRCTLLL